MSARRPIPPSLLKQHVAIVGKTGAGKTWAAKGAIGPEFLAATFLLAGRHIQITPTVSIPFWVAVRAFEKVVVVGECWEFCGRPRNGRHCAIEYQGRPHFVHRVSYAIFNGPIPDGLLIRHECDNPPCMRPDHLISGTHLDNVADMHERGRAVAPPRFFGLANSKAHLTFGEVERIRREWATGAFKTRDLAAKYGCSQSTVCRLIHRRTRAEA